MEIIHLLLILASVAIIAFAVFTYWSNKKPKKIVAPKRARNKKGQLKADDKSTPNVNEAWVGGKAPKKRGRPKGSKNKPKK
tara:strand:+ start:1771 stop:2013 length:243 start_codon:yes stop_codon:yes gene_type:complete